MTPWRAVRRTAVVAVVAVVFGLGLPVLVVRAQTSCVGPRYRVVVRSEQGGSFSSVRCDVFRILSWARFDPLQRGGAAPTEELGERYVIVVSRLGSGEEPSTVREDFYPLADGGPLVYAAPGQIFSHPSFLGRYGIPGGWASVDGRGPVPDLLRAQGVPIPEVAPTPSPSVSSSTPPGSDSAPTEPVPTAASTPSSPGSTGSSGPDIVTLLFLGVVAVTIALLVVRRRHPPRETD